MKRMMDCRRAVDLLHELLEDEVSPETHQALMQHFADCPPCRAFLETYKATTNLFRKTLRRTALKELGLSKARDSIEGRITDRHYNTLWRHIYESFQRTALCEVGDEPYEAGMYVDQRVADDGITKLDLLRYLCGDGRQLLIIKGPAGVGKTTFLNHVLESDELAEGHAIVLLDVKDEVDPAAEISIANQVKSALIRALNRRINDARGAELWWRFFLQSSQTPTATLMAAELERGGELTAAFDALRSLLAEAEGHPLALIRLQLEYIRDALREKPGIVLDNLDSLPGKDIRDIVEFAHKLTGVRKGRRHQRSGRSAVVLAMRPITATSVNVGTHLAMVGILEAPVIEQVVQRRIESFLKDFKRRAANLEGRVYSDHNGSALHLSDLVGEPIEGSVVDYIDFMVVRLAEVMTGEDSGYRQLRTSWLQKLTNYNTRLCLIATTQFIASGHIPFADLIRAFRKGKPTPEMRDRDWALKTLLLGVRPVFATRGSWVFNVFYDGQLDEAGVMIRLRTLRLVCSADRLGMPKAEITTALVELFDYPEPRVETALHAIFEIGLVEEEDTDQFRLTGAGEAYLELVADFEYLQHIVIDSCVGADYLLPCRSPKEVVLTRAKRVLLFAEWILELETKELSVVIQRGQLERYAGYYGRELSAAGVLTAAEQGLAAAHRPRADGSENEHQALVEHASSLRQRVNYEAVERAARDVPPLATYAAALQAAPTLVPG